MIEIPVEIGQKAMDLIVAQRNQALTELAIWQAKALLLEEKLKAIESREEKA